jgi:hypothetical protein
VGEVLQFNAYQRRGRGDPWRGLKAAAHEAVARKILPLWQEGRSWNGKKWKGKGDLSLKQIMKQLDLHGNKKYYRRALNECFVRLFVEDVLLVLEAADNEVYYWDKNSEK